VESELRDEVVLFSRDWEATEAVMVMVRGGMPESLDKHSQRVGRAGKAAAMQGQPWDLNDPVVG
jgi:hypothetical protein